MYITYNATMRWPLVVAAALLFTSSCSGAAAATTVSPPPAHPVTNPPIGGPCAPLIKLIWSNQLGVAAEALKAHLLPDTGTGLSAVARCPHAVALMGIVQLREDPPNWERAVQSLSRASRAHPTDWVSHALIGAAHEFLARRLAAHVGSGPAESAALELAGTMLRAAATHRLAWLRLPASDRLAALPHVEFAPSPTSLYRSLGGVLLWQGNATTARAVFEEAVSIGQTGWVSPWARPLHPHPLALPAPIPFFVKADGFRAMRSLLATLEAALPDIRNEFFALYDAGSSGGAHSSGGVSKLFVPEAAGLHEDKKWSVLLLGKNGELDASMCASTPRTCAAVRGLSLAAGTRDGQVKFSVMQPGTHVKPHAGPSNARLRVHCTLVLFRSGPTAATFRVGEASRHWYDNECFAFDESFEHEVTTTMARNGGAAAAAAADGPATTTSAVIAPDGTSTTSTDSSPAPSGDYRAVLLLDIANPFLATLADFRRYGVSEGAWHRDEPALTRTWEQTREDVQRLSRH